MNDSYSEAKISNGLPALDEQVLRVEEDRGMMQGDVESDNSASEEQTSSPGADTETEVYAARPFSPARSEARSQKKSAHHPSKVHTTSNNFESYPRENRSTVNGKPQMRTMGGLGGQAQRPKVIARNGSGFRSTAETDEGSAVGQHGSVANLSEWAPSAKPLAAGGGGGRSGVDHLPDWNMIKADDPTSRPIANIQTDLNYSMQKLMNESVFEQLIQDALGRHRFREFLVRTTGTEHKLDMLSDLMQYSKQADWLKRFSEGVYDMYLAQDSDAYYELPADLEDDVFESLKKVFQLKLSFGPTQDHLRRSLFKTEFQIFVKSQLVEHNRVRLGSYSHDEDQSGLGDCFCLTNPRLRENPIVLVSPGFTAVTGYSSQSIIGRNCRFLQGPSTAPESVQRIRDVLNGGQAATELLLNYRKDGTPFFCLLTIIPLRDASGQLAYFLGGQTNVTGQLASSKGLSFLIGGGAHSSLEQVTPSMQSQTVNGVEVSHSLARYLKTSNGGAADAEREGLNEGKRWENGFAMHADGSIGKKQRIRNGSAAGSYDPILSSGPGSDLLFDNFNEKKSSGGSGRFMSKFFGGESKKQQHQPNPFLEPKQRLMGAEGVMRKDHRSLQDQMEYFSSLYSKIIIFKRSKREITFVTRELIAFLGLPTDHWTEAYASPLVHADVTSLLRGSDKEVTKAIQATVKDAIRKGHQVSVEVAIKAPSRRKMVLKAGGFDRAGGGDMSRYTTIHFTPLKDRENSAFAYVAVVA